MEQRISTFRVFDYKREKHVCNENGIPLAEAPASETLARIEERSLAVAEARRAVGGLTGGERTVEELHSFLSTVQTFKERLAEDYTALRAQGSESAVSETEVSARWSGRLLILRSMIASASNNALLSPDCRDTHEKGIAGIVAALSEIDMLNDTRQLVSVARDSETILMPIVDSLEESVAGAITLRSKDVLRELARQNVESLEESVRLASERFEPQRRLEAQELVLDELCALAGQCRQILSEPEEPHLMVKRSKRLYELLDSFCELAMNYGEATYPSALAEKLKIVHEAPAAKEILTILAEQLNNSSFLSFIPPEPKAKRAAARKPKTPAIRLADVTRILVSEFGLERAAAEEIGVELLREKKGESIAHIESVRGRLDEHLHPTVALALVNARPHMLIDGKLVRTACSRFASLKEAADKSGNAGSEFAAGLCAEAPSLLTDGDTRRFNAYLHLLDHTMAVYDALTKRASWYGPFPPTEISRCTTMEGLTRLRTNFQQQLDSLPVVGAGNGQIPEDAGRNEEADVQLEMREKIRGLLAEGGYDGTRPAQNDEVAVRVLVDGFWYAGTQRTGDKWITAPNLRRNVNYDSLENKQTYNRTLNHLVRDRLVIRQEGEDFYTLQDHPDLIPGSDPLREALRLALRRSTWGRPAND